MGRVALVVTELGNNLALHTPGGSLLLRRLAQGELQGVEILSIDSGPGVANFNDCMRDGYSTAGTPGTGLGAVKRASHEFAVYSQPGAGTTLLCELWEKPSPPCADRKWQCGAVSIPYPGEPLCGDSWAEQQLRPGVMRVMIADGLGHGEFAAEASMRAVDIFTQNAHLDLIQLVEKMHDGLRSTRGAALAVTELDLEKALVSFVGVGNIAAAIVTHEEMRSFVSMNGTIGAQARAIRLFTQPWPNAGVLVMNSDGLKSRWRLDGYAGLLDRHPGLIAGVLHRDYLRGNDDSTVVVARLQR